MHTVDEIIENLTDEEKERLVAICIHNDTLKARIAFVRQVLIGRLQWSIQGWDIMEYNFKLLAVANRLLR